MNILCYNRMLVKTMFYDVLCHICKTGVKLVSIVTKYASLLLKQKHWSPSISQLPWEKTAKWCAVKQHPRCYTIYWTCFFLCVTCRVGLAIGRVERFPNWLVKQIGLRFKVPGRFSVPGQTWSHDTPLMTGFSYMVQCSPELVKQFHFQTFHTVINHVEIKLKGEGLTLSSESTQVRGRQLLLHYFKLSLITDRTPWGR